MRLDKLKKAEIIWMENHKCKHGHTFLAHRACYIGQYPDKKERIGFLDIEASNLNATFGIILSYCIKKEDGEILEALVTPEDLKSGNMDKNVLISLLADLEKFDRIVVYYGTQGRFDIPMVRSRALYHGLDFPGYKSLRVTDVWDMVRYKLRLHRNSLKVACEFLDIPAKAHLIKTEQWLRALSGNKKALQYILTHNREDVVATELLFKRLVKFSRLPDNSI